MKKQIEVMMEVYDETPNFTKLHEEIMKYETKLNQELIECSENNMFEFKVKIKMPSKGISFKAA